MLSDNFAYVEIKTAGVQGPQGATGATGPTGPASITVGATGTFTSADNKTITVTNGLITGIA